MPARAGAEGDWQLPEKIELRKRTHPIQTFRIDPAELAARRRAAFWLAERCDDRPVGRAAARSRGQVEERAGLAVHVKEQLQAAVRPREAGHVSDVRRVVAAPQAPLGDRERLPRVAAGRSPL